MQQWLSFQFYPLEAPDVFLVRALRPFLEQYIWPNKGTRGFFIRYEDEKGPHIRIRLRGETEFVEQTLRPAFETWFAGRGEYFETPYQPETARFGGEEGMALAEEHFHLSTRVILERLRRENYTYGDAMFDALRLSLITAFAADMNGIKTEWYFGKLEDQWMRAFFVPADGQAADKDFYDTIRKYFEDSYAAQKAGLQPVLQALWEALQDKKLATDQPEWLRWLRGNELILKELGKNLDIALPSLIHLSNNRLGINNQDEVFLNHVLSKLFQP